MTFEESIAKAEALVDSLEFNVGTGKMLTKEEWKALEKEYGQSFMAVFFREIYKKKIGMSIITPELASELAFWLGTENVIDPMAGSGYLANILKHKGIRIKATDLFCDRGDWPSYQQYANNVTQRDFFDIDIDDYDAVIVSWPDYDSDIGVKILNHMYPGQILVYIGESRGGCCANDAFFDTIYDKFRPADTANELLSDLHLRFQGAFDSVCLYTKV